MLNGHWTIDIADTTGLSVAGLVLLRNGIVLRAEEAIEITGTYEQQGNGVLATLDVVLSDPAPTSDRRAERVLLHVQGQTAGHVILASGVHLSDPGRRAKVRLERRALVERQTTLVSPLVNKLLPTAEPPRDAVEDVACPASNTADAERSSAGTGGPRFPKTRLPHRGPAGAGNRLAAEELAPPLGERSRGATSSALGPPNPQAAP